MNVCELVRTWFIEKGLNSRHFSGKQLIKLAEECDELRHEVVQKVVDLEKVKLEIGDCVVVLTGLALQHGLHIEDCLESAYHKIKNRKGKTVNGVFIKEEDYSNAK